MITRIQILLTITAAASSSFLQTPSNQLESAFNSTFLTPNEKLFKPIIIPNISEPPQKTKETAEDGSKTTENLLKFSSRYSSKERTNEEEEEEKLQEATKIPNASNEEESKNEETTNKFSVRSDTINDEESTKDSHEYQSKEEESEEEERQMEPTEESPKYLEKDSKNHEISTTEETSSEEKKEEEQAEDKRSVDDYYNSGSKNYHSIQTPLSLIKYQGGFRDEYISDRKRIINPIRHRPTTQNWPYSRSQIENLNEISERDESYEKELDEEINEEVKTTPKQQELESAEEKDRQKFDRSKEYNYIELRDRRKQQQKALTAEEEKDDRKPLFQNFKQYQVDEEEATQQPKDSTLFDFEKNWAIKQLQTTPTTTPKNQLNVTPSRRRLKIYSVSKQGPDFQGPQFLGPVVFSHYLDQQKSKQEEEEKPQNTFLKGLIEKEKLDQNNLSNQKYQKTVYRSKETQSFNHLKESDDMYNAILANIQSVFGLRTKPLKSGTRNRKETPEEVNLDESRALTWTLPLKNDN